MNDAQFAALQDMVRSEFTWWLDRLGLRALYDWRIEYKREHGAADSERGGLPYMTVWTDWRYLQIVMTVYGPTCAADALNDGVWNHRQIEEWVVHELMHVVLDEVTPPTDNPFRTAFNGHAERVCEIMSKGMIAGRRAQLAWDTDDVRPVLGKLRRIRGEAVAFISPEGMLEEYRESARVVLALAEESVGALLAGFPALREEAGDGEAADSVRVE